MSDNWKPGDMALCIGAHAIYPPEVQPGSLHTVEQVWPMVPNVNRPDDFDTGLDLAGIDRLPGDLVYWAGFFIKITPGTVPQTVEIERDRFKRRNPWKVPACPINREPLW